MHCMPRRARASGARSTCMPCRIDVRRTLHAPPTRHGERQRVPSNRGTAAGRRTPRNIKYVLGRWAFHASIIIASPTALLRAAAAPSPTAHMRPRRVCARSSCRRNVAASRPCALRTMPPPEQPSVRSIAAAMPRSRLLCRRHRHPSSSCAPQAPTPHAPCVGGRPRTARARAELTHLPSRAQLSKVRAAPPPPSAVAACVAAWPSAWRCGSCVGGAHGAPSCEMKW